MTSFTPSEMGEIIKEFSRSAPVGWLEADFVPTFGPVHVGELALAINRGHVKATLESIAIGVAGDALQRAKRQPNQIETSWRSSSRLSSFDLGRPVILMRGRDQKFVLIDGALRVLEAKEAGISSINAFVVGSKILEKFRVDIASSEYQPELSLMRPGKARGQREAFYLEKLSQPVGSRRAGRAPGEAAVRVDDRVYLSPHVADDRTNTIGTGTRRGAPSKSPLAEVIYRHLVQHVATFIDSLKACSVCKNDADALDILDKIAALPSRYDLLSAIARYRRDNARDNGWKPADQMRFICKSIDIGSGPLSPHNYLMRYTSEKARVLCMYYNQCRQRGSVQRAARRAASGKTVLEREGVAEILFGKESTVITDEEHLEIALICNINPAYVWAGQAKLLMLHHWACEVGAVLRREKASVNIVMSHVYLSHLAMLFSMQHNYYSSWWYLLEGWMRRGGVLDEFRRASVESWIKARVNPAVSNPA